MANVLFQSTELATPPVGTKVEVVDVAGEERQSVTISDRAGGNVDSIGGLTETAPATDTASSGLNGRLQRIAQRISSLIALLPTALGTGGGLKVDGSGTALPISGTVTATGSFFQATQPVSAVSLPLPTGAATEATLAGVLTISDFDSKTGALTETAPATDTASSGLNGRLQRIAQRITSLIVLLPTALGSGGGLKVDGSGTALPVSAGSLPLPTGAATETTLAGVVTIADFDSKIGALTETAPATDTASSGLNGRLQRIAQRLSSLIALVPTALGAGGGLKIDGSGTALPVSGTVTATIAAGATTIAKAEDVASADADVGVPALAVRKAAPANTSGTDGDYEFLQMSAGRLWASATIDAALPAGANAIGKLAANSGVTIGAVEIAAAQTLGTVSTITNVVHVDDNAGSLTVDAPVGTPVFVRLSDGSTAIATLPVSLASVPSHAVTNAGTFAVQATEADGANTTLGAKADAKSTATDTTAITAMSVWKQISASVQLFVFGAGTAAAAQRTTLASDDPAVATLGATTGAAVITDANGTIQQYLRGLVKQWIAGTLVIGAGTNVIGQTLGGFTTVDLTITRPNDTTAYAANDTLADSTSSPTAGGFTLSNCARASGKSGMITDALISMSTAAATPLQGELWIFDTSVTAVNDNAAFTITDGEMQTLVGVIPFTANKVGGPNQVALVQGLNIGFTTVGSADLRCLVKVINAYTPAAQEVLKARLKIVQVN